MKAKQKQKKKKIENYMHRSLSACLPVHGPFALADNNFFFLHCFPNPILSIANDSNEPISPPKTIIEKKTTQNYARIAGRKRKRVKGCL